MRLGNQICCLKDNSISYRLYGKRLISERHRHRYEVNNVFVKKIEKHGMKITGTSIKKKLVEIIELSNHLWFLACQFHPEFTSTPRDGHPLFTGFIKAATQYKNKITNFK